MRGGLRTFYSIIVVFVSVGLGVFLSGCSSPKSVGSRPVAYGHGKGDEEEWKPVEMTQLDLQDDLERFTSSFGGSYA